ncbi:MAG: NAD(P)-binding domain-containing protein [Streptosporangiaceae bacterium]
MTTAIIGTGGIGSAIARQLASGGETLRLSSADTKSARTLAAEIGRAAVVAADNHDVLQGADAVVLALRFTALKGVIDEIADALTGKGRGRSQQPGQRRRTRQHLTSTSGRAVLRRGHSRVAAGGGAPGHGVWKHVGRSLRVR